MDHKFIDAFAKKAVEYMYNYKVSDEEYLTAFAQLEKWWIATTNSDSPKNMMKLKSWINKAIMKFAADREQMMLENYCNGTSETLEEPCSDTP